MSHTTKSFLKKNMKTKIKDIISYIVGNYRYELYYSSFKNSKSRRHPLMRQHIFEQIKWRIKAMDKECYNNGECKLCGCQTTALQMANKSCDKPCYPPMMNKKQWLDFIEHGQIDIGEDKWRISTAKLTSSKIKDGIAQIYKNDIHVHTYQY